MIGIKKIQKIKTPDGYMVPIYRNWDYEINEHHEPKMVYATTLEPGVEKEIILHERRTAYITCIQGSVLLEAMVEDQLEQHILNFEQEKDNVTLLLIPNNIPIKLSNIGNSTAILINCPDPSWHPENPDTIKFKNWSDFKKWKNV